MINREQFVRWWKDFDPHENYYTQEKSCAWASWQASAELSAGRIAELEAKLTIAIEALESMSLHEEYNQNDLEFAGMALTKIKGE